ncbi:MAG: hypothetical protein PVG76_07445 [Chromatiales bacterium]
MTTKTMIVSTLIVSLMVAVPAFTPAFAGGAAKQSEAKVAQQQIPGKPQAPVDIRYRFESEPAVGQPMTVTVFVTPLTVSEDLKADYRAKGMLGLSPMGSEWGSDELGRDSLIYTLEVTPSSEGRALIQVIATIQIAGTLQNRVLSIPVQTGAAGAKPVARYSGKVSVGASGEAFVSMPAETEIIPVEPQ